MTKDFTNDLEPIGAWWFWDLVEKMIWMGLIPMKTRLHISPTK